MLLTGCAGAATTDTGKSDSDLPAAVAASGKLRVGISPAFPPMEYRDEKTNQIVGVDVDIANALAQELGVELEVVEQPFDQLINSVATGRVDIVISGISDTVERQKTVDFVDYFASHGRFYTLQERASEFTKPEDLCGKKVAVSKKTDYYLQVQDYDARHCSGNGLPKVELLPTDSGSAARLQLEQRRADVAVQGAENLAFFEKSDPTKFEPVLDQLASKPFGVVIKKGDKQMADAVHKGLTALVEKGTYKSILDKWGVSHGAMTPTVNGVKE
jgi:polar amino acid transport system substrate-binding protein